MTQRSLATSAIDCARLFNKLLAQANDRAWELCAPLSQLMVEDEIARYKIWGGNLGAFQRLPATSSLDFRMRESPKLATQIQELLEDLRRALERISAIASGQSPNRVAGPDSDFEDDEDQSEDDSSTSEQWVDHAFTSEFESNEKPRQLSEVEEMFGSLKDTITSLFRISIIIRKASPRDRFAKALAARQEPFDDRYDIDHVSHKFPMLRATEKEWFKTRVGKAITRRRQYLRYAREHRDKLAKEPQDLWQPEDVDPRMQFSPVLSQAERTNVTKPTGTFARTTASTLHTEMIAVQDNNFQDVQSQTSYAVSLGDDDNEPHLQLPSLVDVSKDGPTFECPLCWTIQDIQKEGSRRKHALGDLKPYICTFEDCDFKLFSDRREWFEHELSHHRGQWRCEFCIRDDFHSVIAFQDHIRSCHMQGMTKDQLDALSVACKICVDQVPALECPFCHEWEAKLRLANPSISRNEVVVVTPAQFRQHVGAHMQQLALFSIPRGFLENDPDNKSVASLPNPPSIVAGLRKAEMALEFGTPEDALKRLQELSDLSPDNAEVHSLLSKCYHQIGNESAGLLHGDRARTSHALTRSGEYSEELPDPDAQISEDLEQIVKVRETMLNEDSSSQLVSQHELPGDSQADEQMKEEAEPKGNTASDETTTLNSNQLDEENRDTLQEAAVKGDEQIVKTLLRAGADINAQGGLYGSALQAASSRGHEQIVRALLRAGADVNTQGGLYGNALQAALSGGYEQIVRALLRAGADVNAQDGFHGNALQAASSRGYEQIVRALLRAGADVNAQGGFHGNALQAASSRGYEQIVRALLRAGADVNAQGGLDGNALQAASSRGHEQIVRALLRAGADVNAKGGEYGNALEAASDKGHKGIIKMLLDAGARRS